MNKLLSTIIKAGIIVGTLDILSACTYYYIKTRGNPLNVLKFVASGVFGRDAFTGGNVITLAGLILHYTIAFLFTLFFFWLYPKIKAGSENKIMTGIIYGIFTWTVMNLVVVPLSNVPARPFNVANAIINAVILVLCIGIPLSIFARKFYKKEY